MGKKRKKRGWGGVVKAGLASGARQGSMVAVDERRCGWVKKNKRNVVGAVCVLGFLLRWRRGVAVMVGTSKRRIGAEVGRACSKCSARRAWEVEGEQLGAVGTNVQKDRGRAGHERQCTLNDRTGMGRVG